MLKQNWTITRRLYATVGLILLLATLGGGYSWWMEKRATATQARTLAQREHLLLTAQRVRLALLDRSDALRGLLLEPTNLAEQKRRQQADQDFTSAVQATEAHLASQPDLGPALRALSEHHGKILRPLEERIAANGEMRKAEPSNPPSAFPIPTYEAARRAQDELLQNFTRQVEAAANRLAANGGQASDEWRVTSGQAGSSLPTYSPPPPSAEPSPAFSPPSSALLVYALAFVLCLALARSLVASINQPLLQLIAAAGRLRGGDFTQRLELRRQDEFGQLAEGFNHMTESLNILVGQVQRSGIQVNTSATQIAATSRQQQATSIEIATTTTQIGATSHEISVTSQELVRTMSEVSTGATQTAQLAGHGQSGLARLEETMSHVMEAASAVSGKLAVLNEKAGNINQVVTTITKVADQTNLLSLNAAIEAEKAGEYGRGFAVVATEIRRLADQTAVATYDIAQMVKEMQTAVSAGVMGMDKFSEEVRRGAQSVQEVSRQFVSIIQQVQELTPRFGTVVEGMEAQATGAQQISDSLAQLGESARQTADSLRHSSATVEQLNEASAQLQNGVSRFRLQSF